VVLTGELSENELLFHATAIYATGGMLLSGDDLTAITPAHLALLRKLSPPTGVPARFTDESFRVGELELSGRRLFCLPIGAILPRRSPSVSQVSIGFATSGATWTWASTGPPSSHKSYPPAPGGSSPVRRLAESRPETARNLLTPTKARSYSRAVIGL
jgi:hypothetical protein